MDIREELNVPPKRRITIPEGYQALILSKQLTQELKAVMLVVRKGRRPRDETELKAMHDVAGDILLAIMEAEDGQ